MKKGHFNRTPWAFRTQLEAGLLQLSLKEGLETLVEPAKLVESMDWKTKELIGEDALTWLQIVAMQENASYYWASEVFESIPLADTWFCDMSVSQVRRCSFLLINHLSTPSFILEQIFQETEMFNLKHPNYKFETLQAITSSEMFSVTDYWDLLIHPNFNPSQADDFFVKLESLPMTEFVVVRPYEQRLPTFSAEVADYLATRLQFELKTGTASSSIPETVFLLSALLVQGAISFESYQTLYQYLPEVVQAKLAIDLEQAPWSKEDWRVWAKEWLHLSQGVNYETCSAEVLLRDYQSTMPFEAKIACVGNPNCPLELLTELFRESFQNEVHTVIQSEWYGGVIGSTSKELREIQQRLLGVSALSEVIWDFYTPMIKTGRLSFEIQSAVAYLVSRRDDCPKIALDYMMKTNKSVVAKSPSLTPVLAKRILKMAKTSKNASMHKYALDNPVTPVAAIVEFLLQTEASSYGTQNFNATVFCRKDANEILAQLPDSWFDVTEYSTGHLYLNGMPIERIFSLDIHPLFKFRVLFHQGFAPKAFKVTRF